MVKNINHGELCPPEPLDDILSIEDVAIEIEQMKVKIDLYKRWKKKKAADADNGIAKVNNRIEFLKQIIIETLKKHKENSLILPGSCKVVKRKSPDKWIITDEKEFIKFLKKEKEFNNIVKIVSTQNIDKTLANKLLNDIEQRGNIPLCVTKDIGKINLSVSFAPEHDIKEDDIEKKANSMDIEEDYDKINFV